LKGIRCPSPLLGKGGMVLSCPDAIGKAIERYTKRTEAELGEFIEKVPTLSNFAEKSDKSAPRNVVGVCPDCGCALISEGGCNVCKFCGYSKC